jgi:tetratricopeptide (TPR) repeat protein
MAVPQTIAQDLLNELNRFTSSNDRPDPFTLARLKREAAKLSNVDYIGGLLCEAIVFTLENNYSGMVRNFEEIISYRSEDSGMYENYGHSLYRLDRVWEAQDQYLKGLEFADDATPLIIATAKSSLMTFRTHELVESMEKYAKKINEERVANSDVVEEALTLNATFVHFEVNTRDAAQLSKLAEEVCHSYRQEVPSGNIRHTAPYSGATITYYAEVAGDFELISDMNFALSDLIADNGLGGLLNSMSYVFVPGHDLDGEISKMDFDHAHHN